MLGLEFGLELDLHVKHDQLFEHSFRFFANSHILYQEFIDHFEPENNR